MHQRLATTLFSEWNPAPSRPISALNRILRRRPLRLRIDRAVDGRIDMTTVEQRIHLVHLLTDAVHYGVEGDVAEIGTFEGKTAVLLTRVLQDLGSGKALHVYDAFDVGYFLGESVDVEARLRRNFAASNARVPTIHKGYFETTLPSELPEKVSFAHLDCGVGPDPARHKQVLYDCLVHLYPRLTPGAVCVLMDYNDGSFPEVPDGHPGVRLATDEFLRDKPEKPIVLYGGQGAMAYFRRGTTAH